MMNLINVSRTNCLFYNLASNIFERKFSRKTFKIQAPSLKKRLKIHVGNDVTLTDIDSIVKVLTTFGRLIRVLKIRYERFPLEDAKEITRKVNEFCADHLTHLGVSGITWRMWPLMKRPFINVQDVAFSKKFETSDTANLNGIFPNLHKLILLDTIFKKPNLLERQFSHLEHLYVGISTPEQSIANAVDKLIKSNPNVRQLSVRHNARKFLEQLNGRLQQIEMLELLWPQDEYNISEQIQLNNVTKLLIKSNALSMPERISFPKLEEVECLCNPELSDQCVGFLKENSIVKKLNITSETTNDQFYKLAGALPHLQEVSIVCAGNVRAGGVVELLKKGNTIDRVLLRTSDEQLSRLLRFRLLGQWKVTQSFRNLTLKSIELQRIK